MRGPSASERPMNLAKPSTASKRAAGDGRAADPGARVADAEAWVAAVAETAPEIVWSSPPNGEPDYFNPRWRAYTGAASHSQGDGSWLMMSSELVTARQEGVKLIVVLIDNGGYGSIGSLSTSLGSAGFGTQLRYRGEDGAISARQVEVDFEANARSLGVTVQLADTLADFREAIKAAQASKETTVIVTHTDPSVKVGGYESWWDVPPAEVTTNESVKAARTAYDAAKKKERWYL